MKTPILPTLSTLAVAIAGAALLVFAPPQASPLPHNPAQDGTLPGH